MKEIEPFLCPVCFKQPSVTFRVRNSFEVVCDGNYKYRNKYTICHSLVVEGKTEILAIKHWNKFVIELEGPK